MSNTTLESLCSKLTDKAAGRAAGVVINLLISLLTEEDDKLENIDRQLRQLVRGYFMTGLNYLNEINRLKNAKLKEEALNHALHQFIMASEVDAPLIAVKSRFFTGVCYLLLGEDASAYHWIEKSYINASELESKLLDAAKYDGVDFLLSLGILVTPLTMPFTFKRFNRKESFARELYELYDFMRPLSDMMFAMGFKTSVLKPSNELAPPPDLQLHDPA